MNTLIVTGGRINKNFLKEILTGEHYDKIIAVDKGLETLDETEIKPDYIIGDFDSINKEVLKKFENFDIPIEYLNPEKDFTDTHMGLKLAIDIKSNNITILGATGTRIDHLLANINVLKEALNQNINAKMIDENNTIFLINKNTKLPLNKNYKYVSVIPLTSKLEGVDLKGFKYELDNATLEIGESIGVSNEQTADKATINIKKGIAIIILSKD